eukprot:1697850-Amphidinium_carterae.1
MPSPKRHWLLEMRLHLTGHSNVHHTPGVLPVHHCIQNIWSERKIWGDKYHFDSAGYAPPQSPTLWYDVSCWARVAPVHSSMSRNCLRLRDCHLPKLVVNQNLTMMFQLPTSGVTCVQCSGRPLDPCSTNLSF